MGGAPLAVGAAVPCIYGRIGDSIPHVITIGIVDSDVHQICHGKPGQEEPRYEPSIDTGGVHPELREYVGRKQVYGGDRSQKGGKKSSRRELRGERC